MKRKKTRRMTRERRWHSKMKKAMHIVLNWTPLHNSFRKLREEPCSTLPSLGPLLQEAHSFLNRKKEKYREAHKKRKTLNKEHLDTHQALISSY
jgi:hypothetical protein